MTTLTTAPLAPLLERLFAEADEASAETDAAVADLSDDERVRLMRSKTDYIDLYGRLKNAPLAVSRETGALLYMLARSRGARTVVEFGTSFGISTLHLAAALRDNGSGRLITTEFEASKVARARENLKAGSLIDLVELREGDALASSAAILDEHLGAADWLVGKHVTYADFRVACVLPFADLAGLPLADFPRVAAWHARLMDIPAWRDPFVGLDAPELPPVPTGAR
jgi:glutathione S-transferase